MTGAEITCLECGEKIGGNNREQIYPHLVHCMHIPDRGLEYAMNHAKKHEDEGHSKKLLAMLSKITEGSD